VLILERAKRSLSDLTSVERRMVGSSIDRLALDALPRGAEALEGRFRDHIRLRVGRFRLLYKVTDGELTIVALLAEPG
jgi:mRNA-degrading endonuclease RelE of RelBE toxin-antitoxin system